MLRIVGVLIALCGALTVLPLSAQAQSTASPEAEARAAFVKLIDSAKKRDVAQFKTLIASADLREMEAMDQSKAGFFDMMMGVLAPTDPKQFTADVQPTRVIFSRKVVTDKPDQKSSERTTFTMVREGTQWKFGKPR